MNELRELQLAELAILKNLVKRFNYHDLTYFLIGGTLLGAVRHNGFIPWDDDIDIGMPRNDYERLISLIKANQFKTKYRIRHYSIDDTYEHFFIKVENPSFPVIDNSGSVSKKAYAWVDIFPLDGHPSSGYKRKVFEASLMIKRGILMISKFDTVVLTKPNRPIYERVIISLNKIINFSKFFNTRKINQLLDKQLKKNSYDKNEYISCFMGAYKLKEVYKKEWVEELVPYQFEDTFFLGPAKYDEFLSQIYGDYMKLPNIEERGFHNITIVGENSEEVY